MKAELRRRYVAASEPDAEPVCRMEPGQRRSDIGPLFSKVVESREIPGGSELRFAGPPDALWEEITAFVEEERKCCPFFSFEQLEVADGVVLRLTIQEKP